MLLQMLYKFFWLLLILLIFLRGLNKVFCGPFNCCCCYFSLKFFEVGVRKVTTGIFLNTFFIYQRGLNKLFYALLYKFFVAYFINFLRELNKVFCCAFNFFEFFSFNFLRGLNKVFCVAFKFCEFFPFNFSTD